MKTKTNQTATIGAGILFAAFALLMMACQKEEVPEALTAQEYLDRTLANVDKAQLETDLAIIDDSLAVWGLTGTVLTEPEGVRYIIDTLGTGAKPTLNSIIRIKYTGRLLSTGEEFDSSERLEYYLYGLIAGFQTTLPLIPTGTKVTLYIPSGLGYGASDVKDAAGNVAIPKNSNLIFEIELLAVF